MRTLSGIALCFVGFFLMDVPIPDDPWQRWIWGPLGVACILLAGDLMLGEK